MRASGVTYKVKSVAEKCQSLNVFLNMLASDPHERELNCLKLKEVYFTGWNFITSMCCGFVLNLL